jgi:hypothetical protein
MRFLRTSILICGVIVAVAAFLRADEKPDEKKAEKAEAIPQALIGSWEQVIAQVGNQITQPDAAGKGTVKSLHITPTHFNRVVYLSKTKQLLGVVGGCCQLLDGKYVETIDYADEASRKAAEGQKPLEFQLEVKQDMLTLKRVGGTPDYSEVWKRVK